MFTVIPFFVMLVCSINAVDVVSQNAGVFFEPQSDMAVLTHSATIVLKYNLSEIHQQFDSVKKQIDLIRSIRNNDTVLETGTSWYNNWITAKMQVESTFASYEQEINCFLKLLPHESLIRRKRTWFDFGGRVPRTVFGTLTSQDLLDIKDKILVLEQQSNTNSINHSNEIIVLRNMQKTIANHTLFIEQIVKEFITHFNTIRGEMNATIRELYAILQGVSAHLDLNILLLRITDSLSNAKFDALNLRTALESSSNDCLNSVLLHPDQFLQMLLLIERKLDASSTTIYHVNYYNLYAYYKLTTTYSLMIEDQLTVIVSMPIARSKHNFEMYKLQTYPVKWNQPSLSLTCVAFIDQLLSCVCK
ncbi:uncharacterized protein LOC126095083 [Schistocerca cancellata]|uniref:uncharacterized protein LOC126095083 n=1 Tax=Schistocerca cancellata TaxID=274614 RepID=UPI002118E457|nr:uncharacterized protein LOC126095083 [Schistocerca cancellata]